MKTEPHFRIIEKQAFIAAVPMYIKNMDGTQMPVQVSVLTDLQVEVRIKNGAEISGYTVSRDLNNNILLDFPNGIALYVYSVLVTAKLAGREIRTYYQEAFEGVKYNRDTTFENFITGNKITLPDSVFVLSADTSAVAVLSEQLQQAIDAAEEAKAEYEQKLHDLQGVAQEETSQQILYDVEHIDFDKSDLAKQGNNTAATNTAILEALSHINPQDPNSKALAEFFGVTLLQGYEFMQDTEVTDELEDIMQALDPELEQEVEYPEGSGTYMTKAQAITAEAMQIINPSQS